MSDGLPARLRGECLAYVVEPVKRYGVRAKVIRPLQVRRFHHFGANSILHRPDFVYGPSQISIGTNVLIMKGAWLAVERSAWERPRPALSIGNGCAFRPYCALSASESIVVEDDVVMAMGCSVVDSDHTIGGTHPNVLYNPTETAPIRIGRGTWLGDRVSVLRGSDIGSFCKIGANSVVRGRIPDHSVAVGAPARVVGSTE